MNSRILSAVVLSSLFASAAHAASLPDRIRVGDVITNSWGNSEVGDYSRAPDGYTDGGCWVKDGGGQSLGRYGGAWIFTTRDDCTPPAGTTYAVLSSNPSLDPTVHTDIDELHTVELEISGDVDVTLTIALGYGGTPLFTEDFDAEGGSFTFSTTTDLIDGAYVMTLDSASGHSVLTYAIYVDGDLLTANSLPGAVWINTLLSID